LSVSNEIPATRTVPDISEIAEDSVGEDASGGGESGRLLLRQPERLKRIENVRAVAKNRQNNRIIEDTIFFDIGLFQVLDSVTEG